MTKTSDLVYQKMVVGFGTGRIIYITGITAPDGLKESSVEDEETLDTVSYEDFNLRMTEEIDDALNFDINANYIKMADWFTYHMGAKIYSLTKKSVVEVNELKE
ncbi:hypothetical protein [Oenococcus oeni]|nr:hypothetical protein [Oenococcus oeni]KEP87905.1 hypothetical protein X279_05175 [Oenococcus oeni IOEB_0501]